MDLTGVVSAVDEQPIDAGDITVSPNPTSATVTITCNSMVWSYRMVNCLGEEISGEIVPSSSGIMGTHEIDMSGMANGVYFVLFRTFVGMISKSVIVIH